jgi:hypothetical protein
MACRNVEHGEQAAQRVRAAGGSVAVPPLDLAGQASVRSFVETFRNRQFPSLAGVICNAGGQNVAAPTKTAEGYETTFAVNHLGHYLLPAPSLFISNVQGPATSGRRLARLAAGAEGSMTGKYLSDGRENPWSTESYDRENALDLWNASAKMIGLPSELSPATNEPQTNGGGTAP